MHAIGVEMILFGMESLLTRAFLQAIVPLQNVELCVLPAFGAPHARLVQPVRRHIITPSSLAETAAMHAIPVLYMTKWEDVAPLLTHDTRIVVCCFPKRIPAWIRQYAHCNIHPSLLPALRGPDPLFYSARGDAPAGVSLHRMDATFDTGAILMQMPVDVSECRSESSFVRAHALVAATLVCDASLWQRQPMPQATTGVTYAPLPTGADFVLDVRWSRDRVRQFMQCTDLRQHPYWVPQLQHWVYTFAEVQHLTWELT